MPSPKSGTVVEDLRAAIAEVKGGGLLEYRAEGEGDVTVTIADTSFIQAKTLENMKVFFAHLLRTRTKEGRSVGMGAPTNMIGDVERGKKKKKNNSYFLQVTLQSIGGPPISIDPEAVTPTSAGYFR